MPVNVVHVEKMHPLHEQPIRLSTVVVLEQVLVPRNDGKSDIYFIFIFPPFGRYYLLSIRPPSRMGRAGKIGGETSFL